MNPTHAYLIRKARDQAITQSEFQALALKCHFRMTGRWDTQHQLPALEALPCGPLSKTTVTGVLNVALILTSPGGSLEKPY